MTKMIISVTLSVLAILAAAFCLSACNPEKFENAGKSLVSEAEDYVINEIKNPINTTAPSTQPQTTAAQTTADN